MITAERRGKERFSLEVPVMMSIVDKSREQKPYEYMTRDISSGGAFLMTDDPIAVGTDVKMDIVLSFMKVRTKKEEKKTHIDISGYITRTEDIGMAVCFDKQYSISPYNA